MRLRYVAPIVVIMGLLDYLTFLLAVSVAPLSWESNLLAAGMYSNLPAIMFIAIRVSLLLLVSYGICYLYPWRPRGAKLYFHWLSSLVLLEC